MDPSKLHVVDMPEHFDSMNLGLDQSGKVDLRRNRKKSFRVKTLLFDYITDPSITTIAYADCDILFGLPGCARRFIEAGTPFTSPSAPALKVTIRFTDAKGEFEGIHCGTMVMHRERSREALRRWRDRIDAGTEVSSFA